MLWKDESEPNIKYCLGTTIGMVERFITTQNIGHNGRRTDGIRVEYFPRILKIGACPRSPKVHEQYGRPNNSKDELSLCRCSMTSCGEIKTIKRNVLLIPHLCLYSQKDFQQDVGHSSDLGQKQSGISVNQLSIYGAVSELCEEYSICQTSTGRPVVAEQSDPFIAQADLLILTPTSSVEIPAQENLLQKHKERVENLSQPYQLIKVCTDAGFPKTVEVGQYFMTKDTEEFSQFTDAVVCREHTLPRDEETPDPKGWIRGNTKIGHVLEVTTCCLQSKYGVEIRIESMNKDHSHSWVRISHGLNKLVTNLNDNE